MYKSTLSLLLIFVFSSAHAVLEDDENTVIDAQQNLIWLDLTETFGLSYSDALAANPGWQYATEAQFINMINQVFPAYQDNTALGYMEVSPTDFPPQELFPQITMFQEYFGTKAALGLFLSLGFYEDSFGILRNGGVEELGFLTPPDFKIRRNDLANVESARSDGIEWVGTWLVKSTAPDDSVEIPGQSLDTITTSGAITDAKLYSGFWSDSAQAFTTSAQVGDTISLSLRIEPESSQLGMKANVLVIAGIEDSNTLLMVTPQGLLPFDQNNLLAFTQLSALQADNQIEIFNNLTLTEAEAGSFFFHVAYYVIGDSTIYYNQTPFRLNITP